MISTYYYSARSNMTRTPIIDIFAKNLKENRKKKGLTQSQLAEKVNVTSHHIAMIETEKNNPAMDLVERIANVLNIEYYELFIKKPIPKDVMDTIKNDVREVVKEVVAELYNYPRVDISKTTKRSH